MTDLSCLTHPPADIYKVLLNNSPGNVIIKDSANKIVWCNKKALKMFNKKLTEIMGKTCVELWPDSAVVENEFESMDTDILNENISLNGYTGAHFMEWTDGKDHLIRVDKIPYRNKEGMVNGVVTFVIDMTESLEEHIMKYNSDIEYHEMRASLNSIISTLKQKENRS